MRHAVKFFSLLVTVVLLVNMGPAQVFATGSLLFDEIDVSSGQVGSGDDPGAEPEEPEGLTDKADSDQPARFVLNETSVGLQAGETYTLTYTLLPENANPVEVQWLTSNTEIATVEDGLVTAVAEGVVEISVSSVDDQALNAACVVEVIPADAHIPAESEVSPAEAGEGYGSNGNFLEPIEAPASTSTPISTRADLEAIKDNLGGNYHLTMDIDLNGAEWVPIGDADASFTGSFDGQGHVIRNMVVTGEREYGGLFGYIRSALIKNVGLESDSVAGAVDISALDNCYAGAICGFASSSAFSIDNCYNTGGVSAASAVSFSSYAGGICGSASASSSSSIKNCYNTGSITAAYAGGISGHTYVTSISSCYNAGQVSATRYAGGICGYASSIMARAKNCYNTGKVTALSASSAYAGGIFGYTDSDVNHCFNAGEIDSTSTADSAYAGGICGDSRAAIGDCYSTGAIFSTCSSGNAYAGGICAYYYALSSIKNSYNIAVVFASGKNVRTGGICGFSSTYTTSAKTFTNCYAPNLYGSEYGTLLSNAQMKEAACYAGFDFDAVWNISAEANDGYPYLRNMPNSEETEPPELEKPPPEVTSTFTYLGGDLSTSGNYISNFFYSDRFFENDAYEYHQDLATMSLCLSMAAFAQHGGSGYESKDTNVVALLRKIGFEGFEDTDINTDLGMRSQPEVDSIGAAFALKPLTINNAGDTMLLAVAVRGGGYEREWGGNFKIGESNTHEGFDSAKEQVVEALDNYMGTHAQKLNGKKVKLWITGYSRGSAVANLLGAHYDNLSSLHSGKIRNFELNPGDIFTYGFEVPAATRDKYHSSDLYKNIFSIVNPNDLVPKVAPATKDWGYRRYGETLYLPSLETIGNRYSSFENSMLEQFIEFTKSVEGKFTKEDYSVDDFSIFTLESLGTLLTYRKASTQTNMPQSVWLDGFIDDAASQFFRNPSHYVATHQSEMVKLLSDFGAGMLNKKEALKKMADALGFLLGNSDDVITFLQNMGGVVQAHYAELCLAWMNAFSEDAALLREWRESPKKCMEYRFLRLNCPVDVYVYDSNHNLVASIIDDIPQTIEGGYIISAVDEAGQKTFCLPAGEDFTVEVLATGAGNVSYSISEYNRGEGAATRIVNYYDIAMQTGEKLTGTIPESLLPPEADYSLLDNGAREIPRSEDLRGDDAASVLVDVEAEGNGAFKGQGIKTIGEYARVVACPDADHLFDGWYEDGVKVSENPEYTFRVENDRWLTAKFYPADGRIWLSKSHIVVDRAQLEGTAFGVKVNNSKLTLAYDILTASKREEVANGDVISIDGSNLANGTLSVCAVQNVSASLIVRVYCEQSRKIYAECRVDVEKVPEASIPYELKRVTNTTLTLDAYRTYPAAIRISRVLSQDTVPWKLAGGAQFKFSNATGSTTDATSTLLGENFLLEAADEGTIRLKPSDTCDVAALIKSSYKFKLLVSFDGSVWHDDIITETVTVKINKKLPVLKAAAATVNTFFTNEVTFSITGDAVHSLEPRTPADWYTVSGKTLTIVGTAPKKANIIALNATLYGWTRPVVLSAKVSVASTAPKVVVGSKNVKLYGDASRSTGVVVALKSSAKISGVGVEPLDVTAGAKEKKAYTVQGQYSVTEYDRRAGTFLLKGVVPSPASGTLRLSLTVAGGRQKVYVPLKISIVKSGAKASLKTSASSVTLNQTLREAAEVAVGPSIADMAFDTRDLKFEVSDHKGKNLAGDESKWELGVTRTATGVRIATTSASRAGAGYKVKIIMPGLNRDKDGSPVDASKTIAVKTIRTDKNGEIPVTATVSVKGSVDLTLGKSATATVKFKNYLGSYSNSSPLVIKNNIKNHADFGKEVTSRFTVERLTDKRWSITAKEDLSPGKYLVLAQGNVSDRSVPDTRAINLNVKASKPRVTLNTKTVTLYKNDKYSEGRVTLTMPASCAAIQAIVLDGKGGEYFEIHKVHGTTYAIGFSKDTVDNNAASKTIRLKIFLKGSLSNTPAQTITVKVNVA